MTEKIIFLEDNECRHERILNTSEYENYTGGVASGPAKSSHVFVMGFRAGGGCMQPLLQLSNGPKPYLDLKAFSRSLFRLSRL